MLHEDEKNRGSLANTGLFTNDDLREMAVSARLTTLEREIARLKAENAKLRSTP